MTAEPLTEAELATFREGLRTGPRVEDWPYATSAVETVTREWADRCRRLIATLDAERERMKPCPFCGHPPMCHKNGECVREAHDDR